MTSGHVVSDGAPYGYCAGAPEAGESLQQVTAEIHLSPSTGLRSRTTADQPLGATSS